MIVLFLKIILRPGSYIFNIAGAAGKFQNSENFSRTQKVWVNAARHIIQGQLPDCSSVSASFLRRKKFDEALKL